MFGVRQVFTSPVVVDTNMTADVFPVELPFGYALPQDFLQDGILKCLLATRFFAGQTGKKGVRSIKYI